MTETEIEPLRDAAEYNEASETFDPCTLDSTEDIIGELLATGGVAAVSAWVDERQANVPGRSEMLKIVHDFTMMVISCEGNALRRWGLYFALGFVGNHTKWTMEKISDHYGYSDAMLSREAKQWIRDYHLPIPEGMKSAKASQSYRRAQLKLSTKKT